MQNKIATFLLLLVSVLLAGCYNKDSKTLHDLYDVGDNFIVDVDSLPLLRQQPEEFVSDLAIDTFAVYHGELIAVVEFRTIPTDSIDSLWVQVAKDQETFGWTHRATLNSGVVPDDPISQFISFFSDSHILISLVFLIIIVGAYIIVKYRKREVPIVHFNDAGSFYPTLLCLTVACAATFYATLQHFARDLWIYFYYHPTLNPFSVPMLLGIFLCSVWAIVIISIAMVEDVRRQLPMMDAVLYMGSTFAMCGIDYIVFSISTLYYIGYPLLVAYITVVIWHYWTTTFTPYMCGNCGSQLKRKGRCPHCGTMNN